MGESEQARQKEGHSSMPARSKSSKKLSMTFIYVVSYTSCIYWCWCSSVLGGFITPADSSSTSLGIGLSIALKAERGIPDWLWGAIAQWSEHLQLKQEALGSIPSGCPGFFLFQLAYTNVNGMKDLWCSSTVWLLSTQI